VTVTDHDLYCTFFVGKLFFCLPVNEIQEVIGYQEMTKVPLADTAIHGLINLRGQIVTAIDLRRRLGLADRKDSRASLNVVIKGDHGSVCLVVDEIGDVVELDQSTFELPPPTLRGVERHLTQGVFKLGGHLLLLLDTARAVSINPDTARAVSIIPVTESVSA